jgi:hypothetical protein
MTEQSEATYSDRSKYLSECISKVKERGVQIDTYTLGVHYSESHNALGFTVALSELDSQPIYATALVWEEATESGLPIQSVLEATIDHEFIHEVHRSRVRRELSMPFDTPINESIIHGVQLQSAYRENRSKIWNPDVMNWLRNKNMRVRKQYYQPLVAIAESNGEFASMYQGILNIIQREIDDPEYMKALGILR